MFRLWLVSLIAVCALSTASAEPPAGGLDPNDPLFKALQDVQREVDSLRREAGGNGKSAAPSKMSPPSGMSTPGMSTGGMAGPAPVSPVEQTIRSVIDCRKRTRPAIARSASLSRRAAAARAGSTHDDRYLVVPTSEGARRSRGEKRRMVTRRS
ncbi:MAG: hypothetical protein QM775_32130 [Pirellulales bacterium]